MEVAAPEAFFSLRSPQTFLSKIFDICKIIIIIESYQVLPSASRIITNYPIGTALPNFLLWSKIFQLPPFLRIFENLERTKKRKGGSTKKGGSWGVRFLED